ncbi:hypothetical protein CBS101457_003809 [Exobasidium rhododendri]|nr:hypothetical protein CBS101457_003809 [Exobasidium rhododendri]
MVSAPSLRQSSRAKKPSKRAEEMQHANEVETTAQIKNNSSEAKPRKSAVQKPKIRTSEDNKSPLGDENASDANDGGEYEEGDSEEDRADDEEEESAEEEADGDKVNETPGDGEVYCTCRKGDNGKPMVSCAECNEWFHFKCVGLTKKVAATLAEYVCPACKEKTGRISKTIEDGPGEEEFNPTVGAEASSPPRRPSLSSKRKSTEDESPRKRSKGSPYSSPLRKPDTASAPSTTMRKMSGSTTSTGSRAVLSAGSDAVRKHALMQFIGVFDAIFAESVTKETEEERDITRQSREYGTAFEASLFQLYGETSALSSTILAGKTYRDRLRTFLFNLKDKSNMTLRQKIASGEISARELAGLSNEELANDEIRKEVERRKRENLEQSILKKEKAPLRKLTHKGEIDIEYEASQSSRIAEEHAQERELLTRSREEAKGSTVGEESKQEEDRDVVPTSPIALSTTAQQGSPTKASEQPLSTSAQSPPLSFDFTSVWTGDVSREDEGEDEEDGRDEKDVGDGKVEDDDQKDGEAPETITIADEEGADNFIDDFLGMPEGHEEVKDSKSRENDGEEASFDGTQAAQMIEEPAAWRGAISMPDEGVFTGKVRQVAGRPVNEQELSMLFPSTHSVIEGRLPTESAAPYLIQSRVASRTELVVLSLELSWEPDSVSDLVHDAPQSEDENKVSFEKLLSYFQRRSRYGVLPSHPSAKGRFVKDFYIVPLPKYCNIPQWLEMMEAEEFQGEAQHTRRGDMFLLVAVLFKQAPLQAPQVQQALNVGLSPLVVAPSGAFSPPSNLGALLGGSATLRDLLKAVGGNQSPAQSTGVPGYQSPLTLGTHVAATAATSQATMDKLSEMPKPQLEEMLHKNPNLVDELLKTLSGAKKVASPSPRPPGPPPPPPPALQGLQRPLPYGNNHPYPQAFLPQHSLPPAGYPSYDYTHPAQQQQQQHQQHQQPFHPQGGYPASSDHGWQPNTGYQTQPTGYNTGTNTYGAVARGAHRGGPPSVRRRY